VNQCITQQRNLSGTIIAKVDTKESALAPASVDYLLNKKQIKFYVCNSIVFQM